MKVRTKYKLFQYKYTLQILLALTVLISGCSFAYSNNQFQILRFDKETVVNIEGIITQIQKESWYDKKASNFVATVKTNKGKSFLVDLGCEKLYKTTPAINSSISVRGSKITYDNKTVILGITADINNTTITIRSKDGIPKWIKSKKNSSLKKRRFFYKMRRNMRRR
jgi:hypothetical protein